MSSIFTQYPAKGGVATYANFAAFPAIATNGTLAVALDTGYLYEYNANTPGWQLIGPGGGSGTVSSVGLSAPSIFTVSGSPVTTTGTLSFSLNTQSANTVFAGPASGGASVPTFRPLVAGDIPSLPYAQDAFTIIQPDSGTAPTATSPTSTLTLHNTDGHITIVGNSLTKTITLNTSGLQPAGTYVTSVTGTAPIVSSGGTTPAISIPKATTSVSGYLSNIDWTTFNSKQASGNYLTGLTGPVTASGPGNATATITPTGVGAGLYGSSVLSAQFNVNAAGQLTSVTNTNIAVPSLVYQPGGTESGNVYTNWNDLYAALTQLSGSQTILFDDTYGSIAIPTGTYDMAGVVFTCLGDFPTITLQDGCVFTNQFPILDGFFTIISQSTSTVYTLPSPNTQTITLTGGVTLECTSAPMIEVPENGQLLILMDENAQFQSSGYEVLQLDAGADCLIFGGPGVVVADNTVTGVSGSNLIMYVNSSSAKLSPTQTDMAGTIGIYLNTVATSVGYSDTYSIGQTQVQGAVDYCVGAIQAGLNTTVALAKLTPTGTNGSLTVTKGLITGYTAPT